MPLYEIERIVIEVVSAIACFILVRFMIKPFQLTGETRYLGLPIGFGILAASYAFSAFSYSSYFNFSELGWVQLFIRGFAFLVLAITYYSSKTKKNFLAWNPNIILLILTLVILISLVIIISPQSSLANYQLYYLFVRVFSLICLGYISIHALKSHVKRPDLITLAIPVGYILLSVDQYSSLIWVVDRSFFALFGGLAFRLVSLAIFLYLSYKALYSKSDEGIDEENCTSR
jgi:hypothetical protein